MFGEYLRRARHLAYKTRSFEHLPTQVKANGLWCTDKRSKGSHSGLWKDSNLEGGSLTHCRPSGFIACHLLATLLKVTSMDPSVPAQQPRMLAPFHLGIDYRIWTRFGLLVCAMVKMSGIWYSKFQKEDLLLSQAD